MTPRLVSSLRIGVLALLLACFAPTAFAQGGGSGLSASDVSEAEIESAARIVFAMQQLQQKYMEKYGDPQDMDSSKVEEIRTKMQKEQRALMQKKVQEEDLSMSRFQRIVQASRRDSTLRQRMKKAVQETRKKQQGGNGSDGN